MADVTLSSIAGSPRRAVYRLTASDAAFPVPAWAQGGKGTVLVTGVGAGGSGATNNVANQRGGGGGGGAFAVALPMIIPAGTTTIAVTIGAGGAAVTSDAVVNGNAGGNTQVTVGPIMLNLGGGTGAVSTGGGNGGFAYLGTPNASMLSNGLPLLFFSGQLSTPADICMRSGIGGGGGTSNQNGFGAGSYSLWGIGGAGISSVIGVTNGDPGIGFGAGGAGGGTDGVASATVSSGAGAPGFVMLEFVEGF